MNFQNIFALKIIICFSILLFSTNFIYTQIKSNEQKMTNANFKYGVITELKINEEVCFDDSLKILLTSFSHKRPYTGGPTKATAYLTLSKANLTKEITLSVHGVDGKSESEDSLSDSERYDSLLWNAYEFQLKSFNYDTSIEIIISKTGPEKK
jgi:hypothetical protein